METKKNRSQTLGLHGDTVGESRAEVQASSAFSYLNKSRKKKDNLGFQSGCGRRINAAAAKRNPRKRETATLGARERG